MKEPIKILIVDDEAPSREALGLLLKSTGYEVTGTGERPQHDPRGPAFARVARAAHSAGKAVDVQQAK